MFVMTSDAEVIGSNQFSNNWFEIEVSVTHRKMKGAIWHMTAQVVHELR